MYFDCSSNLPGAGGTRRKSSFLLSTYHVPGIAHNSFRSRYYYSSPPPIFHLRTLRHTEVFVSCWASGKHYDSLMFSILIREPLESTLVEGKRMRQDWTEGAIELQCSLNRNLSPHYEEL